MLIVGWVATTVGVALFHAALIMTVRANSDTSIPFYRNAGVIPTGSIALRAGGAGLLVLGAVLLSTEAWYLPFAVILVGPVAAMAVITFHNKRVAARASR